MTYKEEDAIRERIVVALRDAFPDRAEAMSDQVARWFTRHWRNPAVDPIPDGERCRLCDVSRRYSMRTHGNAGEVSVGRGSVPLCSDCVRDAHRLIADARYPSRDMVRLEALRALHAEGLEESARFVEELASAFPELARAEERCSACERSGPVVRGARASLCGECLRRLRRDFDLLDER